MPWIPLHESGIPFQFVPDEPGRAVLADSIVTSLGNASLLSGWRIEMDGQEVQVRMTPAAWTFPGGDAIYHEVFWDEAPAATYTSQVNTSGDEANEFTPNPVEFTIGGPSDVSFGFYIGDPAPGMNVQWLLEVFTPCFWKEPVLGATQSCAGESGGGDSESNFMSRIVGSGGGFILQKSDWTGPEPNIIRDALDLGTNGTITHSWDGGAWVPLSPTVPIYYEPTGFGPDPDDPGDYRVLVCNEGDWNATGLPPFTPTLVRIDFGLAGIAEGTVESAIGS